MTNSRDAGQRPPRESRPRERDGRQRERANTAWATEPNSPRSLGIATLAVGGSMVAVLLAVVVLSSGILETPPATPSPTRTPIAGLSPPAVTPLASPPAEPAGDGTTATIETELGDIVIELFTDSAPVATSNFISLAEAGFYDGVVFHRIIPGFMIQGGDPRGDGTGGPGYTIVDEPVVGQHVRGMVAMARTSAPNSQGSQFFILVGDAPHLANGGYTIFGRVTSGMEVADEIVSGPSSGPPNDRATDPVPMITVIIDDDL